jgi:hypothetical protein
MENDLINLAYTFYPKGVYGLDEDYNKTKEIFKLRNHCKSVIESKYEIWIEILRKIESRFKGSMNVFDTTNFFISKPSFSCELIYSTDDKKVILEIFRSFLIPYFYISENTYYENSLINHTINSFTNFPTFISESVKLIAHESTLIPSELLCKVVPNVSFDTIGFGDFVLQHAFFNKEKL